MGDTNNIKGILINSRTFRKLGHNLISFPSHEPIKRVYILMFKELIEEESEARDEENN